MILKPQDVLFLLKLIAIDKRAWTYNSLALELNMSPSEVHASAKRALAARLAVKKENKIRVNSRNLQEFLLHGVPYVFLFEQGQLTRGIPTAYAAPPMASYFVGDDSPPPVWPDPNGQVRGVAFSPLYKSAPQAAMNDNKLYELLVLLDSVRSGQAREKKFASDELTQRMESYE